MKKEERKRFPQSAGYFGFVWCCEIIFDSAVEADDV